MKKNIFLFGGGSDSDKLRQFNNRFMYVLKANDINEIYVVPFGQKNFLYKRTYEKVIGLFNNKTHFKLIKNVDELINVDQKSSNVALYMAGGNVMRFMHIIRGTDYFGRYGKTTEENQILLANPNKINIEQHIVNFVNNGGFYYGTSAGAILAGKSLNTQMHETSNEDRIKGLNILDGYSVSPHYIKEEECNFYNNLERELGTILIRLADNDGVYYNKDCNIIRTEIKENFIKMYLQYIRTVQNNMILLEINREKLPFSIDNWELTQRGMQHNLNKFQDYTINNFINTQNDKDYYISDDILNDDNELLDIDICEICCDIFSRAEKFVVNPLEYFLDKVLPNNSLLIKQKDKIIFILELLISLNESNCK